MAVQATAIWRARPSGSNTNGGGYDPGIAGAGTDYSQQNAAQLSVTDAACTTPTTTVTSATGGFTAAMIGNAMRLSGTNFTTGFYFITAVASTNSVTVDRTPAPSANASAGTCNVGGGWADFWTNTTTTSGPVVAGNTVYILGSGIPNPSSYTYDYTITTSSGGTIGGDDTNGKVNFFNDPATPNYKVPPDTTGGMPVIKYQGGFWTGSAGTRTQVAGLWFVNSAGGGGGSIFFNSNGDFCVLGCVIDWFNVSGFGGGPGSGYLIGCELFNSPAGRAGGNLEATGNGLLMNNNLHDLAGGIDASGNQSWVVIGNIVANCNSDGFTVSTGLGMVIGNTFDGNSGSGILVGTTAQLSTNRGIFNNLITNHTVAGKAGLKIGAGTTAVNNRVAAEMIDYNTYYNNTANYSAIGAGAHDTALASDPYVGQSTQNLTLK